MAKLTPNTARDAVLTGKRYAADDALAAGFADGKAAEGNLVAEAVKLASSIANNESDIRRALRIARDERAPGSR